MYFDKILRKNFPSRLLANAEDQVVVSHQIMAQNSSKALHPDYPTAFGKLLMI